MSRARVITLQEEGLRESLRTLRVVERWMLEHGKFGTGMPLYDDVRARVKHLEWLLGPAASAAVPFA